MRRIKVFLFLMLFVVISPALAFEDDFQDHPGGVITDVWAVAGSGSVVLLNYPVAYSQSTSLKVIQGTGCPTQNTQESIKIIDSFSSNYWSFVYRFKDMAAASLQVFPER